MKRRTRIMMVDDHRLLCDTLIAALNAESDLLVVGAFGSAAEALQQLDQLGPDLMLVDIALPDMTGMDLVRQAMQRQPGLRMVALSGYAEKMFVDEMLKAGALAYVVKSSGIQELLMAIRAAMAGHVFLSPEVPLT